MLGLLREIVAANYFGARGPINAFTVAFQIPNLVRALVADAALSSAFVPVSASCSRRGRRRAPGESPRPSSGSCCSSSAALTALFILAAPVLIPPLTGAYDDLAVTLSRILFPIVVLLGLFGIVAGILNSYDAVHDPGPDAGVLEPRDHRRARHRRAARRHRDGKLYVYAGSIVVGTVIQLLLPLPVASRARRPAPPRARLARSGREQVFELMVPVMLGLGLINVNAVIGTVFASQLIDPTIAPTAIDKAFRIYMLPQGMFSVAVATVLFPSLARLARAATSPASAPPSRSGLRQIAFLLIPAAVICAVLAEPIVRLLYQRGAFDPAQTTVVAGALAAFSLGLTFNGMMLMLNRALLQPAGAVDADADRARRTSR